MKTFAIKLKSLRLKQDLLLRQVAAAIDVDTSMVSKFENGERFPTRDQIERLASFFKQREADFLIEAYSDKLTFDFKDEPLALEILKQTIKKIKSKNIEQ